MASERASGRRLQQASGGLDARELGLELLLRLCCWFAWLLRCCAARGACARPQEEKALATEGAAASGLNIAERCRDGQGR